VIFLFNDFRSGGSTFNDIIRAALYVKYLSLFMGNNMNKTQYPLMYTPVGSNNRILPAPTSALQQTDMYPVHAQSVIHPVKS